MDLNTRCQMRLDELAQQGLRRQLRLQPACSERNTWLDFSSNDYLLLSQHPEVIEAGHRCAQQYGAGATGSRLLSGHLPCFEELEAQVADFKHSPAALVFSTGYQANASVLSTLLSKSLWDQPPCVFTDRLNHASLHHACNLAGLKQQRFRHNDMGHLAELLNQTPVDTPKIIATETVFGMDGDLLPVEELAQLALAHQATVYLDEAHATGVWGPEGRGLGAIQHPAIESLKARGQWIVMGTFSKAVGVSGAYVACSAAIKEYLINQCGGFVYSTAPSPFVVGAVQHALTLIPQMSAEREALKQQAEAFRQAAHAAGWSTGSAQTHIVPLIVGEADQAMALKFKLLESQMVVSAIRPPTVPPHTARLRLALNVSHTASDWERVLCGLSS